MFAVIKTGGKQYRVAKDDVITVEKLNADAGDAVAFGDVLMVAGEGEPAVGAPLVDGATVTGEVVEQSRAEKIIVFKKKRRKNYRRTKGHRQNVTVVRITDILTGGAKPKVAAKAKAKAAPKAEAAAKADAAPKSEAQPAADAKPAAEEKKAAPKKAPAKKAEAKKAEAAALFSAPDGAADDLKKISGVGPVLEKKLNALGITQYAQIAAFSAEDIERVDTELNFKGRVERDDWIGQAKTLADAASS